MSAASVMSDSFAPVFGVFHLCYPGAGGYLLPRSFEIIPSLQEHAGAAFVLLFALTEHLDLWLGAVSSHSFAI